MTKIKKKSKLAGALKDNKSTGNNQPDFLSRNDALKSITFFRKEGRYEDAAKVCGRMLQQNQNDTEFLFLLGSFMSELEDYVRGSALLTKAIELKPDFPEAYLNLGNIYDKCKKYKEACQAFKKAIDSRPDYLLGWYNMACILKKIQNTAASIKAFQKALSLDPNHTKSLSELPSLLFAHGRSQEAWEVLDKLYTLTGDPAAAISRDSIMPVVVQSWEEIYKIRQSFSDAMDKYASSNFKVEEPQRDINRASFRLAYHALNNKEIMRKQAAMYSNVSPHLLYTAPHCSDLTYYPKKDGKIRIGFISKFFYVHSVSRCYNRMIEHLANTANFEVYLISTDLIGYADEEVHSVASCVKTEIKVPNKIKVAQQMVSDLKLDILLYTEIGMDQLSYCLAYARLAPIQGVLPGHPDTTGINNIDYFISCTLAEIENAQNNYTEELLLFSDIPQYLERPKRVTDLKSKEELKIPTDKNIYSCPMKMQKLHPDFDIIFEKILEKDKDGVILLFNDQGDLPNQLVTRLKKIIKPEYMERIVFVPWASSKTFPHYLVHSDVILDPFHFGGGTTCYMIFSEGVPMVTWPGEFLSGRCAISCYKRMDIMELVAKDWDDYVDIAVKVGTDKKYRDNLQSKILEKCDVLYGNEKAINELSEKLFELSKKKGIL